jgi:hypothetical protein
MLPQTMLDIASHPARAQGIIEGLGCLENSAETRLGSLYFTLNPIVKLESGPACELWGLDLRLSDAEAGEFRAPRDSNMRIIESHAIAFTGAEPLFPRRPTRAGTEKVELFVYNRNAVIVAQLSVGSSLPVEKSFRAINLSPS